MTRAKKVVSINAEGTSPRLATIEWYKQHNNGKLPVNDSLLSVPRRGASMPYILLDHWGTMSFAQGLSGAIDLAENGFPVGDSLARAMASVQKLHKYPTSMKVYLPEGHAPKAGEIFRNPDLARTLRRLVEAETRNKARGRHEALKAARDRFYKGDIAREMAKFSEDNGGLFRYEDFANYTAKLEEPVSIDYRGYQVYKNASASQGPAELFALRILEGYDLKALGLNTADYIHTSVEAIKLAFADRDKYLGDMDFIKIPYAGLLSENAAERRQDKAMRHSRFDRNRRKFTSDNTPLIGR
jgi:gamma-glutamyltranspeptidase/glutathione hydrolase